MSNPIGWIAHRILVAAIDTQTSAIQLRLEGDRVVVYYESDGAFHQHIVMPAQIFAPVITRYKIWADVDLINRRYPLKGQFSLVHAWRHYCIEAVWDDPRQDPKVTLSIITGGEALIEEDGPEDMTIL
jgi:type II secretory ATPase GspE/PulE/Tfp pilus assembly ATPase PilB-like protein